MYTTVTKMLLCSKCSVRLVCTHRTNCWRMNCVRSRIEDSLTAAVLWLAMAVVNVVGKGVESSESEHRLLAGIFFIFLCVFLFCVLNMYVLLVLKGNDKKKVTSFLWKKKTTFLFSSFFLALLFSGLYELLRWIWPPFIYLFFLLTVIQLFAYTLLVFWGCFFTVLIIGPDGVFLSRTECFAFGFLRTCVCVVFVVGTLTVLRGGFWGGQTDYRCLCTSFWRLASITAR